jgi:DNA polymerase III subunit epsilon
VGPVHPTPPEPGGRLLRASVAPIEGADQLAGLVLTLEDVTRAAQAGEQRDAALLSLSQGTRAALGTIRAAIESLLDYPDMDAGARARFLWVIHDEAQRLSGHVDDALRESAAAVRAHWSLADVSGDDLLAALARELGAPLETEEPPDELWLEIDSFAVVQAVAFLAGRVRELAGAGTLALALRPAARYARLELAWEGAPPGEERLREWADHPLHRDGGGMASTLKDVVDRHGGELWSEPPGEDGRARLLLLLPRAETTAPVRPARPRRRVPAAAGSRPEFYDFDLFRSLERTGEWAERPLAELSCTVFDTETTGLDPSGGDEIVAIGAVRIVNGRLLRRETLDVLIDPGRRIPANATDVHGISNDMVRGQPLLAEALPAFARFAEDTVLVGHNVAFDMRFLELKEEATRVRLRQPVLDTLLLSAVVFPDEDDHSLEALAARLGLSVFGRHTALGDAIFTGEVFLKEVRLLAAQGVVTLGQARDAVRRTYQARMSERMYARA